MLSDIPELNIIGSDFSSSFQHYIQFFRDTGGHFLLCYNRLIYHVVLLLILFCRSKNICKSFVDNEAKFTFDKLQSAVYFNLPCLFIKFHHCILILTKSITVSGIF
jgi:hypothetical protein